MLRVCYIHVKVSICLLFSLIGFRDMDQRSSDKKRILLVYYSFSSQTKNLLQALVAGLKDSNVKILLERLEPVERLRFPIGSIPKTVGMMILTFFRWRFPIKPISQKCYDDYDLIILAGPTWSYNPSGPVLSFIDRDGKKVFKGKRVVSLISCRGYWRVHWYGLKYMLKKCGAIVSNVIVFCHTNPEPWRTIGVFLKLAGRIPEKKSWISSYYKKYGHTRQQVAEARRFGEILGKALAEDRPLESVDFDSSISRS